jgi:hypothetical protein
MRTLHKATRRLQDVEYLDILETQRDGHGKNTIFSYYHEFFCKYCKE